MGKSHIGKGGIARPCIAAPGMCPYGGAEAHWDSPEAATRVADSINMQLSNLDGFGIAEVNGYAVPNAYTQKAILKIANFDEKIKKMDVYKDKARSKILKTLLANNVKSVDTGDVKATTIAGGTVRQSIDSEKFYADTNINHEAYLKESDVSGSISFENTDERTKTWSKKNAETAPDFEFNMTDGKLDQDSIEAIKNLGIYEAQIKAMKQTRKEVLGQIREAMEAKDVEVIKVGKIELTARGEHVRETINTQALRASGIYDDYVKETITIDSVRMTYRKAA